MNLKIGISPWWGTLKLKPQFLLGESTSDSTESRYIYLVLENQEVQ